MEFLFICKFFEFILILLALTFFHEVCHFFVARITKCKVEFFSFFGFVFMQGKIFFSSFLHFFGFMRLSTNEIVDDIVLKKHLRNVYINLIAPNLLHMIAIVLTLIIDKDFVIFWGINLFLLMGSILYGDIAVLFRMLKVKEYRFLFLISSEELNDFNNEYLHKKVLEILDKKIKNIHGLSLLLYISSYDIYNNESHINNFINDDIFSISDNINNLILKYNYSIINNKEQRKYYAKKVKGIGKKYHTKYIFSNMHSFYYSFPKYVELLKSFEMRENNEIYL